MVAQIYTLLRLLENYRASYQQFRFGSGILRGIGRTLRNCHVAGCFDKAAELSIRDGALIHPEATNVNTVYRGFLGIVRVGSHRECPFWDPHHVREGRH
jgi:hypothetical protein